MATNVRTFASASSEKITLSLGATGFAFGPGTVLALVNFTTVGSANETVFSVGAANAQSYMLQLMSPTPNVALRLDGIERHSTTTSLSASAWYLIGATKATGTATPRMHIYTCSAGTWSHEDANSSIANSSTPVTRAQFGTTPALAAFLNGKVQLAAVWNSVLDDTAFNALVSLEAIIDANPDGLWILDQAAITTPVPDYTGNGADESSHTGTSVSSATIPNFDMSYPCTAGRTYKRFYGPAQLSDTATTLYTVPTGKIAIIRYIHVSNPSAAAVDYTLSVGADAAGTRMWDDYAIAADSIYGHRRKLTLTAGESIQAFAGSAATLVVTISGWEASV